MKPEHKSLIEALQRLKAAATSYIPALLLTRRLCQEYAEALAKPSTYDPDAEELAEGFNLCASEIEDDCRLDRHSLHVTLRRCLDDLDEQERDASGGEELVGI